MTIRSHGIPRGLANWPVAVLTVLLFVHSAAAEERRAKHHEDVGGFSYQPPAGWRLQDDPRSKFKVVIREPIDGFPPNINVNQDIFPGTLEEFADSGEKVLKRRSPPPTIISRSDFETSGKAKGIKTICEATFGGKALRQSFYAFVGHTNTKIVFTCTTLATNHSSFDKVFDASMKTFRLDPAKQPSFFKDAK